MSEKPPICVLVKLKVKDGTEEEFLGELRGVLAQVSKEPACLSIHGYQEPDDPASFLLVEIWTGLEEFEEFDGNREYLHSYIERAKLLWAEPRDRTIWDEVA